MLNFKKIDLDHNGVINMEELISFAQWSGVKRWLVKKTPGVVRDELKTSSSGKKVDYCIDGINKYLSLIEDYETKRHNNPAALFQSPEKSTYWTSLMNAYQPMPQRHRQRFRESLSAFRDIIIKSSDTEREKIVAPIESDYEKLRVLIRNYL